VEYARREKEVGVERDYPNKVSCSEVLTMEYARREKEVGEWRGTARIKSQESVPLEGCHVPYIESGSRIHTER
jgi:hypothetical protein